jgi:hypothetical protein
MAGPAFPRSDRARGGTEPRRPGARFLASSGAFGRRLAGRQPTLILRAFALSALDSTILYDAPSRRPSSKAPARRACGDVGRDLCGI